MSSVFVPSKSNSSAVGVGVEGDFFMPTVWTFVISFIAGTGPLKLFIHKQICKKIEYKIRFLIKCYLAAEIRLAGARLVGTIWNFEGGEIAPVVIEPG